MSDEIVLALLALAESQDLRRRANETCLQCLRSAHDEGELGDWSLEEIQVHFERCALVFDHSDEDPTSYPFIETRLGLYVADATKGFITLPGGTTSLLRLGYYRLITLLDGRDVDDFFVLDY